MALADWKNNLGAKDDFQRQPPATVATFATLQPIASQSVAILASVAVANPPERKIKRRLELAKMTFCLDGKPCPDLFSAGGWDSPQCRLCGRSPFEVEACPSGRWSFPNPRGQRIVETCISGPGPHGGGRSDSYQPEQRKPDGGCQFVERFPG
jgi:hypothetical protein